MLAALAKPSGAAWKALVCSSRQDEVLAVWGKGRQGAQGMGWGHLQGCFGDEQSWTLFMTVFVIFWAFEKSVFLDSAGQI